MKIPLMTRVEAVVVPTREEATRRFADEMDNLIAENKMLNAKSQSQHDALIAFQTAEAELRSQIERLTFDLDANKKKLVGIMMRFRMSYDLMMDCYRLTEPEMQEAKRQEADQMVAREIDQPIPPPILADDELAATEELAARLSPPTKSRNGRHANV